MMKLSTAFAVALLAGSAFAHSWVWCTDSVLTVETEGTNNFCYGYPRNLANGDSYTWQISARTPGQAGYRPNNAICMGPAGERPNGRSNAANQQDPNGYSAQFPAASAEPGETLWFRHRGNGHADFNPVHPHQSRIFWNAAIWPAQINTYGELFNGNEKIPTRHLLTVTQYEDGRCGNDERYGQCAHPYTIPANAVVGRKYQIIWFWEKEAFHSGQETYATCWDVNVVAPGTKRRLVLSWDFSNLKYEGCFAGSRLGGMAGITTIPACAAACKATNSRVFSMQGGAGCVCGNVIPVTPSEFDEDCRTPCRGDGTTICGGPNGRNSFYSFVGTANGPFNRLALPAATATNPRYKNPNPRNLATVSVTRLGCFPDARLIGGTIRQRALERFGGTSAGTIELCAEWCKTNPLTRGKNYNIFGLQYGGSCFCGIEGTQTRYGAQVADAQCNMACELNPAQNCGGMERNVVYRINSVTRNGRPVTNGIALGITDGSEYATSETKSVSSGAIAGVVAGGVAAVLAAVAVVFKLRKSPEADEKFVQML